ncbi:DUF4338 domain-containing protein [candidate division KSB1 bacterium]|nr:DUF4338 domain-containing protein [candidate division KSB1 bacterium]
MIIRGKNFSNSDIKLVQKILSDNPIASRRKLSLLIAEQLDWRQPNGRLKDRAVREVLLRLSRKKIISLPSPLYKLAKQTAGVKQIYFPEPSVEMVGRIDDYSTPVFTIVKNNHDRKLWNYLVEKYHYKGCRIIVGRHLKYFIYLNQRLIGCMALADAVLQLSARDKWIDWDARQRQAGLERVINNVRFLILPWVKIKNLASKLLALSARIVPPDWEVYFGSRPLLMESFVDKERFTGASYKAANWILIGQTRGKGRSGQKYYYHGKIKDIYVYPLLPESSLRLVLKNHGENP